MRKCWIIGVLVLLLTGCGAQETFETLGDLYVEPVAATAQEMAVDLPAEIAAPVMESGDSGKLYLCDGYTLTMQTFESGDLNRTLQECTGYGRDALTVMETVRDDVTRYECVWTSAGEGGDQLGRLTVLDDGCYHYVLTVMADAAEAGQLSQTWQHMFNSFRLVAPGTLVSTGS